MAAEKRPRSRLARYGVALLATILALFLTALLHSYVDLGLTAILLAAVMVSAWYGGLGPGLASTALCVVGSDLLLIHPAFQLGVYRPDDVIRLSVFSLVAFLISGLNTAEQRARAALLESRERLRLMVEGALDAVASTDAAGRIVDWNPQAERCFGWPKAELLGRPLPATLLAPPQRDQVQEALERFLRGGDGADLGRRIELSGLRRDGTAFPVEMAVVPVRSGGELTFTFFLRDITERRRLDELLAARIQERGAGLRLLYDISRAANEAENVGKAFRFAVQRIGEDGFWCAGRVFLPDPDAPGGWLLSSHAPPVGDAPTRLDGAPAEARCRVVPEGDPLRRAGYVSSIAVPVIVGRETVAVMEFFARRPVEEREHHEALMTAVGTELGRVLERLRLQEEYAEAVWQQQRRIAHDLHDSLGQELTGLGFMAKSLSESLQDREEARLAGKVVDGLGRSLQQIRDLVKGVLPVDFDAEGLMAALTQLARGIESVYGIRCRFSCPRPVLVADNRVAVHLYRIAQEAVTNAVRHGRPKRVDLQLEDRGDRIILQVEDDGGGIAAGDAKDGSGLRIMRYRAAAMGARLTVEPVPDGGTRVICERIAADGALEPRNEAR